MAAIYFAYKNISAVSQLVKYDLQIACVPTCVPNISFFQHSLILPQKKQAGDEITTILHKKPFVTGHLLSDFYWNCWDFESKATQTIIFFPFQSLLSKTSLNFLLSKWWSDDSIPKFLVNCFRDIFFTKELKPTLNKKCDSIRAKLFV